MELLSLNVPNPTNNWDLDLGLTLMAYRSAVQSSTGFTPYLLLYGKKMRLPLGIIYRPPSQDVSRSQYAQVIRRVLERAHEIVRSKLQHFHERQKDYYDRRTRRERFKPGDSVWHWSFAVTKGIAPKFHEPWKGTYKVTKRLSDVTHEILVVARKSKISRTF